MSDETLWYATYNEERDSFVVEEAGWEADSPVIEYRFVYLIDPNTKRKLGGIDKIWIENGYKGKDFYAFKTYRSKRAFEEDVARMMIEAHQLAQVKNRNYFLCILDLVKARAVRARREYPYIKDYDELFDIGPIDAYRWLSR